MTEREQRLLVSRALDIGERMLLSGGEVSRVEDTISRILKSYGAQRVEVFTILSFISLTAVYEGRPAGYVNVYMKAVEGPFKDSGWPEIVDFGVLQKYQRKGIGSRLMDAAEQIAGQYADTVCLAVGLHNGYGSAQRMYVKRGYIPDGSGVWYHDNACTPYDTVYTNDDDLVLHLSKKLL